MNRLALVLLFSWATLVPVVRAEEHRFPWQFDMSPADVVRQSKHGPYKTFSNGDLETYNGVFNGRAENFQFFFTEQKLRRIGVYVYEGVDIEAAASKWLYLLDTLKAQFGDIETPENEAPVAGDESSRVAFARRAKAIVSPGAKVQMAPFNQPSDASVFSSFWAYKHVGSQIYYVVVYFDRPPNKSVQRSEGR